MRSSRIGVAAMLAACTGTVSDAAPARVRDTDPMYVPGEPAPPVFECDPSAVPEELPLPRLSRLQLENTLRSAIRSALPGEADAIWIEASAVFARYPIDRRVPAPGDLKGGYARVDQSIEQTQIDAMFATSETIAAALTASSDRIAAMLGACATDASTSNDRACLEDFVDSWGGRVMRAPLASEDVAFYADIAADTPVEAAALRDVIIAILNAPQTLYRVEHGTGAEAVSALSAFELAARLSYAFADSPPDDDLWARAADRSLLDAAVYESEVGRLVQSPEAEASLQEFVAEWLRLVELPPLDSLNDDAAFAAFAGDDLPPAGAREQLIDDVGSSFWRTLGTGGSVSDFLGDRRSYARDGFLAGIYDAPRWDGAEPPLAEGRAGLLTRAAMLSTGTVTTRPIHKGYVVRNAILCQEVGAPPPDVNTNPPEPGEMVTTREAVSALTSGGLCGACHTTRINPPGFLTEDFDALGRVRTEERSFDEDGNLVASLPIDTTAVPALMSGDTREMEDAVELTEAIDESGLFHSCFVRHWFRFAHARVESERDGCLLAELEALARSGAPLSEVILRIAEARTFQTRRFEP